MGGNNIVSATTINMPAYTSLLKISLDLPGSAKIKPTSPRGIIANPITHRACHDSLIINSPISLPASEWQSCQVSRSVPAE
jgi:hypothetical protein